MDHSLINFKKSKWVKYIQYEIMVNNSKIIIPNNEGYILRYIEKDDDRIYLIVHQYRFPYDPTNKVLDDTTKYRETEVFRVNFKSRNNGDVWQLMSCVQSGASIGDGCIKFERSDRPPFNELSTEFIKVILHYVHHNMKQTIQSSQIYSESEDLLWREVITGVGLKVRIVDPIYSNWYDVAITHPDIRKLNERYIYAVHEDDNSTEFDPQHLLIRMMGEHLTQWWFHY